MPDGTASLDHLPDDPALLKGIVRELLATHHSQQRQIDQLTHRLDLLLKKVFGPRADQIDPRQLNLFEAPSVELPPPPPLTASPAPAQRRRRKSVMVDESFPRISNAKPKSSTFRSP